VICGHRGAAAVAPENTLSGFLRAYEVGARMVELDVRLTRDEFPVCFHDDRLDRLTHARGLLEERELQELIALRVLPDVYRDETEATRIPLLLQALATIPESMEVLVELKQDRGRPELLVRRTMETVRAHAPRCRFISFDHDLLRRISAFDWDSAAEGIHAAAYVRTGKAARLGVLTNARDRDLLIPVGQEVGAEAVHCPAAVVDADWVQAAQEAGFRVNAWTVNTEEEWRRLADLGVDEITTDDPGRALAYFGATAGQET
jgi:glycerophosphoryl diester phosphodiesterase